MYPLYWSPSMSMMLFYNNNYINLARPGLIDHIRMQIEYYFSDQNLNNDLFLRRNMDAEGYVPVALIASFRRLQRLTNNIRFIIDAIRGSVFLELADNCKVRPRNEPWKWPLVNMPPPYAFGFDHLNPEAPVFVPQTRASTSTAGTSADAFEIYEEVVDNDDNVEGDKEKGEDQD